MPDVLFQILTFYYKHIAQGQDTLQRIISQPRPATSSGSRKFDDLFGSKYCTTTFFSYYILNSGSPPKANVVGDTDKSKKSVR